MLTSFLIKEKLIEAVYKKSTQMSAFDCDFNLVELIGIEPTTS